MYYYYTSALKRDVTRLGKRTHKGAFDDGFNSAMRYYINNYQDEDRQIGVDALLGYINGEGVDITTTQKISMQLKETVDNRDDNRNNNIENKLNIENVKHAPSSSSSQSLLSESLVEEVEDIVASNIQEEDEEDDDNEDDEEEEDNDHNTNNSNNDNEYSAQTQTETQISTNISTDDILQNISFVNNNFTQQQQQSAVNLSLSNINNISQQTSLHESDMNNVINNNNKSIHTELKSSSLLSTDTDNSTEYIRVEEGKRDNGVNVSKLDNVLSDIKDSLENIIKHLVL